MKEREEGRINENNDGMRPHRGDPGWLKAKSLLPIIEATWRQLIRECETSATENV